MIRLTLIPLLFFFSQTTIAIEVFRSIDSPIPSGDYSIKDLRKNQKRMVSQSWLYVKVGGKKGWVERSEVYTMWDTVAQAVAEKSVPGRKDPDWNSPIVQSIDPGEPLKLIAIESLWGLVSSKNGNYWVLLQELTPSEGDLGYVILRKSLKLTSEDGTQTESFQPKQKFLVKSVSGTKLKVEWKGVHFQMDIGDGVSVFDFVSEVYNEKLGWKRVVRRQLPLLKIEGNSTLSPQVVEKFRRHGQLLWTRSQTTLLSSPAKTARSLSSLSQHKKLILKKSRLVRWQLSQLNGEAYWWKVPDEKIGEKINTITTQQLFKRRVFAMETSPAKPNLMFASAEGVFRSEDGKNWKKLIHFEKKDYPIAIAQEGTILIGPYRSDDHGRSFQEYVPWHKIAKLISRHTKKKSHFLEIRKLEFKDKKGQSYSLAVDNGKKIIAVETMDNGKNWVVR